MSLGYEGNFFFHIKLRIMKATIITLSFLAFSLFAHSQNRDFDGVWEGEVTTSNDKTMTIILYIEDNNVYNLTFDDDGDVGKERGHEVSWSKGYGEQLNYVWMNKGGVWTETQVYSLVWINENKLSVHHMRHVSNESRGGEDKNTDWGYTSEGYLEKVD